MKSTTILIALLSAAFALAGKDRPSPADSGKTIAPPGVILTNPELTGKAITYYSDLMAPLPSFKQAYFEYVKAITRIRRARKIERSRQELLKVMRSIKEYAAKRDPFEGDGSLRAELVKYIDISYIVLKQDFDKILDMEDIEAQSYDQEEAHQLAIDLAVGKLGDSYTLLRKAERDYFATYQINVNETADELSQKIEKANKAMEYYDVLKRLFIKVNKEDNYARTAVVAKDIAALEQHAATLVSFAEEGLNRLKRLAAYEGDDELLTVTGAALDFYKNEGAVTYPANIEFFLATDMLDNAAKKFKAIKDGERKQADVDEYNKAVARFNDSVKKINKINAESFKKQKRVVDYWNKCVGKFFDKHA